MLNGILQWNNTLASGGSYPSLSLASYMLGDLALTLNGFSIKNLTINTENEVNTYNRPLLNGRGLLSAYRRGRNISFGLTIKGVSPEDLDLKIDIFRKRAYTKNIQFIRHVNGEVRAMKLNANSLPLILEHYNTNWVKMDCSFSSIDESGRSLIDKDITIPGLTGDYEDEILNNGNDVADIEVRFIINSGGNNKTISFGIEGGATISITENFTSGDVIIFDLENFLVKKNGNEIEWNGDIPQVLSGSNIFNISLGSLNADVYILYNERFI